MDAQLQYLARHRDFSAQLGRHRRRELLYGNLLKRGYENYWRRDLYAARIIFRRVMRAGYGQTRDWRYMLPTLLPMSLHKFLTDVLSKQNIT